MEDDVRTTENVYATPGGAKSATLNVCSAMKARKACSVPACLLFQEQAVDMSFQACMPLQSVSLTRKGQCTRSGPHPPPQCKIRYCQQAGMRVRREC